MRQLGKFALVSAAVFVAVTAGPPVCRSAGNAAAANRMAPDQEVVQTAAGTIRDYLELFGLVDVESIAPGLRVSLKYARTDNFMGEAVYGSVRACYLQRDVSLMLVRARAALKVEHPELDLLMADCLRPRDVQRQMWSIVEDTPMQGYVANPDRGSMHNYGVAVDVTLVDLSGHLLDMGTRVDYFGSLAQPRFEMHFVRLGALTLEQVANREVLRRAMRQAGFRGLSIEWWHFQAFDPPEARRRYSIIESFASAGRSR